MTPDDATLLDNRDNRRREDMDGQLLRRGCIRTFATSPAGGLTLHLEHLGRSIVSCRLCPRLVDHREAVARHKRPMYAGWDYWGRPVPGFGDPNARLLVLGLAPAAHGANRTGRMFTGDRSGDWVYGTLHKFGFSNSPDSRRRDDA